jgi:hypothetical protein
VKNFFAPKDRKLYRIADFTRKERVDTFFVERAHVSTIDERDLVAWPETGPGRTKLWRYLANEYATVRLPPEISSDRSPMRSATENRAKRESKKQKETQEASAWPSVTVHDR